MAPERFIRFGLGVFPVITLAVFCLPIGVGLLGTWLPALGYLPVIGAEQLGFENARRLLDYPGLPAAVKATLVSGIGATALAVLCSLWMTYALYNTRCWQLLVRLLSPLLAVPHAAFAIGFGFLISPSGWLVRFLSPWLTGFEVPPDWLTVKDQLGLSLTAGLVLKEMPFLLLMCLSGLNQLDVRGMTWVGRSFGYSRLRIWTRLILPQLYPQLRLPVLAVLAYSFSVVDVALILGPSLPPTLSVLIDRWFNDPDAGLRLLGAAGAMLLFFMVAGTGLVVLGGEYMLTRLMAANLIDGRRSSRLDAFRWLGYGAGLLLAIVSLACLLVLILWSVTHVWRFPDALPATYSTLFWSRGFQRVADPLSVTFLVGASATLAAVILAIGCLEYEVHLQRRGKRANSQLAMWLVYLPLLVPQIAFLYGIQTVAVFLHVEGTWLSMIGIHLMFVLPYVFLTLSSVYRRFDDRYMQVAITLNGSPLRSYFRVKCIMLAKPIIFSAAIGFAVSVAQYLPTLYLGAGRFMTITTETVSLASGSDRRVVAVYAFCQFLLPLLVYCFAIFLPAFLFRNRRAMQN